MSDGFQDTGIRVSEEFIDGDDIGRLAAVFESFLRMRAPTAQIAPESHEVKQRRFRRDKVVPSPYRVMLLVGDGSKGADAPMHAEFLFEVPPEAGMSAGAARSVLGGVLPGTGTWEVSDEFGPESIHVVTPEVRAHDVGDVARFVFAALRAFGATTPTGRWHCFWNRSRSDPEVPGSE